MNKHHIVPRSRGGTDRRNLVHWPRAFHNAWHILFGNMTSEEAKLFIDEVCVADDVFTNKRLEKIRTKIKEGGT